MLSVHTKALAGPHVKNIYCLLSYYLQKHLPKKTFQKNFGKWYHVFGLSLLPKYSRNDCFNPNLGGLYRGSFCNGGGGGGGGGGAG